MHDGCSGNFISGQQVVDKVRMMGFSDQSMPMPLLIECTECGASFQMKTFEHNCQCGNVFAVTPCSAHDAQNVRAAGKGY